MWVATCCTCSPSLVAIIYITLSSIVGHFQGCKRGHRMLMLGTTIERDILAAIWVFGSNGSNGGNDRVVLRVESDECMKADM